MEKTVIQSGTRAQVRALRECYVRSAARIANDGTESIPVSTPSIHFIGRFVAGRASESPDKCRSKGTLRPGNAKLYGLYRLSTQAGRYRGLSGEVVEQCFDKLVGIENSPVTGLFP